MERVGPYAVDDEGDLTKEVLTELLARAQAVLDEEDPGLSSSNYDLAHAYYTIHLFEVKLGKAGFVSESLGDYSYSRKNGGETNWLLAYKGLVDSAARSSMASGDELDGVERIDKDTPEADMDQSDVMEFEE